MSAKSHMSLVKSASHVHGTFQVQADRMGRMNESANDQVRRSSDCASLYSKACDALHPRFG